MAKELATIPFDDFARRLPVVFDDVARSGGPVFVQRGSVVYRLESQQSQSEDIWKGYDPDQVIQALQQSAGALTGIDREQFLEELHAQREQESQGRHD
ncbi:MAG: hypothetical protein M3442_18925 [Chloroflexota bacterium]|nr:hypothetical protein [Chloroflexota bacterium]